MMKILEQLEKEWHPLKNNGIKLSELNLGSHKKYWWKCERNHEWESPLRNRVNKDIPCPYCSGRKIIIGETDLATTHPEIVKEWSDKNNINPIEISAGSNQKIIWECELKHEWTISPNSRTSQRSGCPYCANKKILKGFNDLASLNPEIAKFWDFDKNVLTPYELGNGSGKKVWWLCEKNHSFEMTIWNRVKNGKNCPYCSNRRVIKGFNDLESQYPKLAKEWDYDKNDFNPNEFVFGSHTKAWWKCDKNHSWKTQIAFRATHIRQSGCPDCSKRVSKGETEVRKFAENIIQEKSLNNSRQIISPYELDIYFPNEKLAIEFNGTYWHSDIKIQESHGISAEEYHSNKIDKCLAKNIKLLYVWQDDWETSNDVMREDIKNAILNNDISTRLQRLTNY